jgi:hypothetical protein
MLNAEKKEQTLDLRRLISCRLEICCERHEFNMFQISRISYISVQLSL